MSPGVTNLFTLLAIFGPEQYEFYQEAHQKGQIRYQDLKANLAKLIAHHFADYRERRRELERKPEYIVEVIKEGKEKAQAVAAETLAEVKQKMGLLL